MTIPAKHPSFDGAEILIIEENGLVATALEAGLEDCGATVWVVDAMIDARCRADDRPLVAAVINYAVGENGEPEFMQTLYQRGVLIALTATTPPVTPIGNRMRQFAIPADPAAIIAWIAEQLDPAELVNTSEHARESDARQSP